MTDEEIDKIVKRVTDDNIQDILSISGIITRHEHHMDLIRKELPKEHHKDILDSFYRMGACRCVIKERK